MPREFSRSQRMAEHIRRELAELVRDEIKDPRIGLVTFTAVKLSRDLSHAVIYCTFIESEHRDEALSILDKAGGYIRRQLAARLRSRTVPELKFVFDSSVEYGAKMSDLIASARSTDLN